MRKTKLRAYRPGPKKTLAPITITLVDLYPNGISYCQGFARTQRTQLRLVDLTLTHLASTKPPAYSLGHLSTPAPLRGNMLPLHSKTQNPAGCFRARSGDGERNCRVRALPLAEPANSVVRNSRNIFSPSLASGSGSTRSQLHTVAEPSASVHQAEREPATEDSLLCTELPDSLLRQSLYSSLAGWWGDLSSTGHW